MDDDNSAVKCSKCGAEVARSDMFGIAPDLLCPECAHGHRKRLQVRIRSVAAAPAAVITYVVIGLAGALFLLEAMGRTSPAALRLSAGLWREFGMPIEPWPGEIWRFLVSCFFHGNWLHILFNCWWIYALGRATEVGFGRVQFVLLLCGSGMFSAGIEWMMQGPSIGLSGVVYGLALFLFVHRRTNPSAAAVMNTRTLNILLVWFVVCIFLTNSGRMAIANWAHGGGAVWGYVVGLASLHARRRLLVPLCAVGTIALVLYFSFEGGGVFRRFLTG